MILGLVDEALADGARLRKVCAELGLDPRTIQRWKAQGIGDDDRAGPKSEPGNELSAHERAEVLALAHAPEHRGPCPDQIVPKLVDRGECVASESTFRRILRDADQVSRRSPRSRLLRPLRGAEDRHALSGGAGRHQRFTKARFGSVGSAVSTPVRAPVLVVILTTMPSIELPLTPAPPSVSQSNSKTCDGLLKLVKRNLSFLKVSVAP